MAPSWAFFRAALKDPAISWKIILLNFRYEVWRWAKIAWKTHGTTGALAVLVSLWLSFHRHPSAFPRSGAVMTLTGLIMTMRSIYRKAGYDSYNTETERPPFGEWHSFTSRDAALQEDAKALAWGVASIVTGTLIWAYGDVLIR